MRLSIYSLFVAALGVFMASCSMDNFVAPNSDFKGRIVYKGEPIKRCSRTGILSSVTPAATSTRTTPTGDAQRIPTPTPTLVSLSKTLSKELLIPLNLSDNQRIELVSFLKTLTDNEFLFNPKYSFPKK